MNINTKYDMDQSVWFMKDNKPQEHKVGQIKFSYMTDENGRKYPKTIIYGFRVPENPSSVTWKWEELYEEFVFATKEELLNSL